MKERIMANADFLALLRGFVLDKRPETGERLEICELWSCAARQNLLPVLAYLNKKWNILDDADLTKRLDSALYAAVSGSVNRCEAFGRLSERLSEEGVAHMPVKGYYLRELYPEPELRTFGDIDVLIRTDDREKADRLMRILGYAAMQDWEPSYSYIRGAEYYELHTNLMDCDLDGRADMREYFSRAWEHAVPAEGLRYAPETEFHFIYIVCHLAKHLYGGGAGMRMYLDVAMLLRRCGEEMDWDYIEREFEKLRLTAFFHTVMNAVRVWFGVERCCALPEPDGETLDALLEYTLSADLFGHLRDCSAVKIRNSGDKTGETVIKNMLFPSADALERRYTFLKKRRWLLPLAWIVRLFANLRLVPARLRELKRVSETSGAQVEDYDRFMQRLGL